MTTSLRIGVIGNGVVGKAQARVWTEHADVLIYDNDPNRSVNSLVETAKADYIFVCVPTNRLEGNLACNTAIIDSVVHQLACLGDTCGTIVIRSTIPLGYTDTRAKHYPHLRLLHYPEFVTERCAHVDTFIPARHIVGYTPSSSNEAEFLAIHLLRRFPGVPYFLVTAVEAEFVKLAMNSIWATKVGLFNELRTVADAAKLRWPAVLEAMLSDGRITHSHTSVPGPDGQRGFGGKCLPKDLANLITCAAQLHIDTPILQATWDRNLHDRNDQKL